MSTQTNKGITYELALELKQAGFPLSEYPETLIGIRGSEPLKLKGIIQEPTLSELIEACGETRIAPNLNTKEQKPIKHLFRLGVGDEWFAEYEFYESHLIHNITKLPIIGFGETPEEAVARLWLKLNE